VAESELRRLRRLVPGVRLVQVIHVAGAESVEEAAAAASFVDTLLLDSGNPRLAVKELGGTGRVHDWAHSRRICETAPVPVLLAGGLNPGNVRAAIERVRPSGIDVCSGLRHAGRLDAGKLGDFFKAIHQDIGASQ
jgi:phosphoribosylanthranilate isomerase